MWIVKKWKVWRHMIFPPPPCHKLSHFLRPPPPSGAWHTLWTAPMPREAASSPQRGPGWMHRGGHHSHFLLPSPPYPLLIESVQPKLAPEEIPIHLSRSAKCWPGYWYPFRLRFFHFCLYLGFSLDLSTACCVGISACRRESLYNRDGPGRIQCLYSSSADVPKWGLYGVAEQKGVWRTVLYNGFRFVLGYRD